MVVTSFSAGKSIACNLDRSASLDGTQEDTGCTNRASLAQLRRPGC